MSWPLQRLLPPLITSRLLGDTGNQLFNPFLGTIAAGIGISNQQLGLLVSLRSLAGLSGPALGAMADRSGYLNLARAGIVLMAVGLIVLSLSNSVWTAGAAMLPMGVALGLINPALQAYVGSFVSHAQRARGLGMFEFSWALAGILGLSVLGWLMAAFGWRAGVLALAVLLLLSLLLLRNLPDARGASEATARAAAVQLGGLSMWTGIAAVGLMFYASLNVMIIHGVWLGDVFGFTPAALGTFALVLGLADLSGALLVSRIGDRFKPRRMVLAGTLLSIFAYLLPLAGSGLAITTIALVLMRALMQVGFVGMLPILSEQRPAARARVLALSAAAGQIGMALATGSGPWLYSQHGPAALGTVSASAAGAALLLVLLFVRDSKETS